MTFYFAWVDKDDLTFLPEYQREDEPIYAFSLQQTEGDFASLEIDMLNPRVGLLASSRKQWAWFSWRNPEDSIVYPLFFGRMVAVPQQLQDNVIRLTFVARPADYEDQLLALAETLRIAPYYDPAWLSEEERLDPDRVLEGRSALWHIDRTTHVVTISDIITGEDTQIDLLPDEVFYDSVQVSYSQSPARACKVEATVQWAQTGSGDVDITQRLIKEFEGKTPADITTISGNKRPSLGMMNVLGGDNAILSWPKLGQTVGGGWTIGESSATLIGEPPLVPTNMRTEERFGQVRQWMNLEDGVANTMRDTFERSPGFIAQIVDNTTPFMADVWGEYAGDIEVLWIPIWRIAPHLEMHWETERARTETVQFTVEADVQPLLTDPGEEEVIRLGFGPVDVDNYIGDRRRSRYFGTTRGHQSFEYLLAAARSALLARARAIDVSFEMPFSLAPSLSCRKSMTLFDPRLPSGAAAGKIKQYSMSMDGSSGAMVCSATIGCCVGRDGSVVADPGDPTYVEEGYVDTGYQYYDAEVIVPIAGDLGYSGLGNYAIDDDGVNLQNIRIGNSLLELEVLGALDEQMDAVSKPSLTADEAVSKVNSYETSIRVYMRPVEGGPFETTISPTVTQLSVPRTIDLEEVSE